MSRSVSIGHSRHLALEVKLTMKGQQSEYKSQMDYLYFLLVSNLRLVTGRNLSLVIGVIRRVYCVPGASIGRDWKTSP